MHVYFHFKSHLFLLEANTVSDLAHTFLFLFLCSDPFGRLLCSWRCSVSMPRPAVCYKLQTGMLTTMPGGVHDTSVNVLFICSYQHCTRSTQLLLKVSTSHFSANYISMSLIFPSTALSYARYDPSRGYHWEFPDDKASKSLYSDVLVSHYRLCYT